METEALRALYKIIFTPENLGIMIAAWFLISVTRKVFPKFYDTPTVRRLLPLFPMVVCMGLIWLPGLTEKGVTWGWKVVLGIVLGWGVGFLHKVLKRTVLGKGAFVEPKKEEATPEK